MMESLVSLDTFLFVLVNSHHHPVLDFVFLVLTGLGDGWIVTPILLLLVIKKIPRSQLAKVIIVFTLAIAGAGIVNSPIKRAVGRLRPLGYYVPEYSATLIKADGETAPERARTYSVHIVENPYRHRSFPSGHTNTAFASATALVLLFGAGWWWVFLLAAGVGFSRVYLGVHFPLDTVAGGLLGIAVSAAIVYPGLRLPRSSRG